QLALRQGVHVIAAVGEHDEELVRELGATPVRYGSELLANVRKVADHVDATFDASGKGGVEEAITLTGDRSRVITLADERARDLGVAFSSYTPDGAPDAIAIGMELHSIDPSLLSNNLDGLASSAKALDVPVILTTVGAEAGRLKDPLMRAVADVFPDKTPIDRTSTNAWTDIREAVEATGRKTLLMAG